MWHKLRYGFRVLAANPAFTLVAALSLALGIGANSAIFSLIDGLWLRPLAVPHAENLVRVFSTTGQDREGLWSYPEYLDLRQAHAFQDLVTLGGRGATLVEGDQHLLVTLNLTSSNFFTALGVKPALGRFYTPSDELDSPGSLVVVLGDSFWRRQFGADPHIIGKQLRIQRAREVLVTVMGVLPPSFRGIEAGGDRDFWFPRQAWAALGGADELERRGTRWFHVLGRLAHRATPQSGDVQVRTMAARMATDWPATNQGRSAAVVSDFRYRLERAGTNGLVLLAIVLLVVLISSVNVANLLLARAGFRNREMAVRLALGAPRGHLVRQLVAENVLLGSAGLIVGLGVGELLVAILPALLVAPPGLHAGTKFAFDSRVLLFSLAISLATVLLVGLAPAWQSTRLGLVPALKGAANPVTKRRWTAKNYLVVAQIAVSMTLLASAGVLVESFVHTRLNDLGFARKPLLLVWLSHNNAKPSLYRDVMAGFEALPGVRSVAAAIRAPLSLSGNGMFQRVAFPGRPEFANSPPFEIKYNAITANFLRTMGTAVVRGRDFTANDETENANAVLINERTAQRFWPDQDPIGKPIRISDSPGKLWIVAGVVRNAPINELGETPEPYLYVPYWANFSKEVTFLIETSGPAEALAEVARRTLKSVDASLDPLTITTQGELIRYSAGSYQVTAELSGALGLLGLTLTAVGLYGVVSYGVTQRTSELGIRMALGAGRRATLGLVLGDAAVLGIAGIAIGLPLAFGATRLAASLLFGVRPWDPPAFAAAAGLLLTVLLAAAWLPARRATRIAPASALRVM
jgi:predicted permease